MNITRVCASHLVACLASLLFGQTSANAQLSINGYNGATAVLSANGTYSITIPGPGWQLAGTVGVTPYNSRILTGTDSLGEYQELAFDYWLGAGSRSASIRASAAVPMIRFVVRYNNGSPNSAAFPAFTSYPKGLLHLTFNGMFSVPSFSNLAESSPWIWFDGDANTLIISAASDYMAASTTLGPSGQIQAGISGKIPNFPAGFTHTTALSFGSGINQTVAAWGHALTNLTGKQRPANDSDALLKSISYWTDNGATYYYNPGTGSYADTLTAIRAEFDAKGIALGSLQLDSWWYPKGPDNSWFSHGGIWQYIASPALFQPDLATFQAGLGIPLIAHARWIDAASPIRSQYLMSGGVATDPKYWEDTAAYLKAAGVTTYEQDWLGLNAQAAFNLTDSAIFLNNMATSMAKRGITIQYCMAGPNHFLQSTNYSNVTTARTSGDRFARNRWNDFLYSSRLLTAVGAWPFTDVFMSTEQDNLILATLSAGPVGIGDPLGGISKDNLLAAVRPDGIIVKPDISLTPEDAVMISDAQGIDVPMVASTWSDFGGMRAHYIFAYVRNTNAQLAIQPSSYGMTGAAYLFDYLAGTGLLIPANSGVTLPLTNGFGYYILAAVGETGIAFLGDKGQFVTLGKARIPALTDTGKIEVSVSYAAGERVRTLFGYSPQSVSVAALEGFADIPVWDPSTQLFTIRVHPSASGMARLRIVQSFGAVPVNSNGGCGFRCEGPNPEPGPANRR
jgi:hypothetical protein